MTTSYTTTKLSHSPMSQAPGKRGHSSSELCNVAEAHTRIGCDFTSCDMEVLMIEIIFLIARLDLDLRHVALVHAPGTELEKVATQ